MTPVLASVTNEADLITSDGNQNLTAVDIDTSGPNGSVQNPQTTGTYTTPDTSGRTVITINGNQTGFAYIVSQNKFAQISAGASDTAPKMVVVQK